MDAGPPRPPRSFLLRRCAARMPSVEPFSRIAPVLTGRDRLRRVVNLVTLGTPLGLLLARTGGARVRQGPGGLLLALGYRSPVPAPRAPAVTVGDVVLLRMDADELA